MKRLHLHIERVVVEGLPESGQRRFMRALEAQLHEWAGTGGDFADGLTHLDAPVSARRVRQRIRALDAGPLRPGASPEQAAAQVVRAIRRGVVMNRPAASARRATTASGTRTTRGGEMNRPATTSPRAKTAAGAHTSRGGEAQHDG
jgi:hypothetical protein